MYGVEMICPQNLKPLSKVERRNLQKIYGSKQTENRLPTQNQRGAVQGSGTAGNGIPKKKTEIPWTYGSDDSV